MKYATADIYRTLKETRESSGLSQRDLSERIGGRQGYLSKIESGGTDLRLSSLVELARALNLEVVLVPRRLLPAVEAVIRRPSTSAAQMRLEEVLGATLPLVETTARLHPDMPELAEASEILGVLRRWPNIAEDEAAYHSLLRWLKRLHRSTNLPDYIGKFSDELKKIRNHIVHSPRERPRSAYTLDDEEDVDG